MMKKMTIPDCEMARSMNDEMMDFEFDETLCAVSGCKNKYTTIVWGKDFGIPFCDEHKQFFSFNPGTNTISGEVIKKMKQIKIYLADWKYLTNVKKETEQSYADIIKDIIMEKNNDKKV